MEELQCSTFRLMVRTTQRLVWHHICVCCPIQDHFLRCWGPSWLCSCTRRHHADVWAQRTVFRENLAPITRRTGRLATLRLFSKTAWHFLLQNSLLQNSLLQNSNQILAPAGGAQLGSPSQQLAGPITTTGLNRCVSESFLTYASIWMR